MVESSSGNKMKSCFQIANITRPLMSVGKICDQGCSVVFDSDKAIVRDAKGKEVCRFTRTNGGLYVCKMHLKAPFPRQS